MENMKEQYVCTYMYMYIHIYNEARRTKILLKRSARGDIEE